MNNNKDQKLKKKMRLSIRSQIMILYSILLGIIALGINLYFPEKFETMSFNFLKNRADNLTEIAAFNINSALTFNDMKDMKSILYGISKDKNILQIFVLNNKNEIISKFSRKGLGLEYENIDRKLWEKENYLSYISESLVKHKRKIIGKIIVFFKFQDLVVSLKRSRNSIFLLSFFIFFSGIILIFYMSTFVTRSLKKIIPVINQIAKGDLTRRVPNIGNNEVGDLTVSFNIMIHNLQQYSHEIEELNKSLEKRVTIRTKDLEKEIEDRKSFQEALIKSETKYRNLLENSLFGVFIIQDWKIVYFNQKFIEIYGYTSADELYNINILKLIARESIHLLKKIFHDIKNKSQANFEAKGIKKDGEMFFVELMIGRIIFNKKPALQGAIIDISNRKKSEQEKQILEDKLKKSQKMEAIGTMAGGLAHDLNNILSGILSYPDLLLKKIPEDSTLRKPLSVIKNSGIKAAAIVQDMLTLSRRNVVIKEVFDLNLIIREYLESPEFKKLKRTHKNINIELLLYNKPVIIEGASNQLFKMVMNLVSNAFEAMPKGGKIKIISKKHNKIDKSDPPALLSNGRYIKLEIEDEGIGISSENISKIFEPFYTKKKMGRSGTGLGMAVVWGIVKDHNGYIDVISNVNKGTKFVLYFPLSKEKIRKNKNDNKICRGNNEKILIVDDEKNQRLIAVDILKDLNFSVTSLSSGEKAVKYLKKNPVDLVILDMIMDPGMDGLETYKEIKKNSPRIKTIIASGYSESERVKEAQILGAGSYLKKPYEIDEICKVIKEELRKS